MTIKAEQADLAHRDAEMLGHMADLLAEFTWAVNAQGKDGRIELAKAKSYAPYVIKALVNYLEAP